MSPHIQCARSKKTKARTKPNILLPSLSPFISPHYHNPATVINTVRRHGDMLWSHKILIACPRAFDGGCQFRNGYLWSTKAPRGARHQPRCHRDMVSLPLVGVVLSYCFVVPPTETSPPHQGYEAACEGHPTHQLGSPSWCAVSTSKSSLLRRFYHLL